MLCFATLIESGVATLSVVAEAGSIGTHAFPLTPAVAYQLVPGIVREDLLAEPALRRPLHQWPLCWL